MARVVKVSRSFTCIPTSGMNHTCNLPAQPKLHEVSAFRTETPSGRGTASSRVGRDDLPAVVHQ